MEGKAEKAMPGSKCPLFKPGIMSKRSIVMRYPAHGYVARVRSVMTIQGRIRNLVCQSHGSIWVYSSFQLMTAKRDLNPRSSKKSVLLFRYSDSDWASSKGGTFQLQITLVKLDITVQYLKRHVPSFIPQNKPFIGGGED